MNLNFNNAAENTAKTNYNLKPGVHDNIVITKLSAVEGPGSPYIKVDFVAEDGNGQHSERFYMSEKAAPYSLAKLKELCVAASVDVPEQIDVTSLDFALSGKSVALRMYGREIKRSDGTGVMIISEISPSPFCSPVGKSDSLWYDEKKAIKRLTIESSGSAKDAGDDLPF